MRNRIVKTAVGLSVLTVLLMTASRPCFAVNVVMEVAPEQASELGMEVRSYPAGPEGVRVELEFKTEGKLESYRHVDLAIFQEETLLMSARLKEEASSDGHNVVSFQAERGQLNKMTLTVVTGDPPLTPFGNRVAYQLQVRDFVNPENLLDPAPGASTDDPEAGFSVQAPLALDVATVNVHVAPEESVSNLHYTLHITVPEWVDQTIPIRNGSAVTAEDVRLVDVNADGFLDVMIAAGDDYRGQPWFKTWLFDQEAGEYRWISD